MVTGSEKGNEKIFVGIPAYRDPELPKTIHNLLENAQSPELLRFGVCFQYDLDDTEEVGGDFEINKELNSLIERFPDQISVDRISYKDARNAYYARHRV